MIAPSMGLSVYFGLFFYSSFFLKFFWEVCRQSYFYIKSRMMIPS